MIEDWWSLFWIRNSALWSIGFRLRRIDHQQQDSQVIDWDGLFIQESQWGRTYCGYLTRTYCEETLQYKWHWNVKSIWKQSGCQLRKIVWTMMKDQKKSFMNRNTSEKRPTVDKEQNSRMIDWDGLFGNNQAANWGRLFDMMEDQKESFMDKNMLWGSTSAYIWYKEVRTPYEADYLKDQIADGGRSLEPQYQWHLDVEYTFGKDSGIRKTEKSSSGTRCQGKLHVRILELNLETQCHETRQGIQTMIQRNQGYGIQMNDISRLGWLCATLFSISILWHGLSSSPMPAPIPPPLLCLKQHTPNQLLYWQSHAQDAQAWAFQFLHQ